MTSSGIPLYFPALATEFFIVEDHMASQRYAAVPPATDNAVLASREAWL
jgi:hypothetical protein